MSIDRRHALKLLGGAGLGAVLLGGCADDGDGADDETAPTTTTKPAPATAAVGGLSAASFDSAASCLLTPEQTEGPYYLDVDKIRSDIREDREGTPLRVAARVLDVDGCTPVKDAVFDLWHCDAAGAYSGFETRGSATRFLRGAQITNDEGIAAITTIYPGWYTGRAVHIHAKVLLSNQELLTTQFYFDDALSRTVYQAAPYAARGAPQQSNSSDRIYRKEATLTVERDGDGYLGLISLGIRA